MIEGHNKRTCLAHKNAATTSIEASIEATTIEATDDYMTQDNNQTIYSG
jgi:hypothetical protein